MNFVSTSLRFAEWALEAVLLPPILVMFVLALGSLSLAAIKQKPFKRGLWQPYHWLVLTHLLFFPAVIAVGVIWANPITNPAVPHHPIETGRRWLDSLMCASLASCVWWAWRMRGFRWFAVSLMLLAEVPVVCGLFISGMSVAGDWI
jgi:hypothetical protein